MYHPLANKKPYGAAVRNQSVSIDFPLPPDMGAKRVFVVLRHFEKQLVERFELDKQHVDSFSGESVFSGKFALRESGIWHYRFEAELENNAYAFFGRGADGTAVRQDWLPEWQLTVSECDYKTPKWSKEGVMYQIFADRFCKAGERVFDKRGTLHSNWNDKPEIAREGGDYRADDFFGGNAEGIISKLGYLKSLNVSSIYLSPVFEAASNHRYDTGDYLKIDSLFGDEAQFERLIKKASEYGINVILDGVFNHTGADSVYFNKFGRYPSLGAYQSRQSPYYGWYYFTRFPNQYHCWWGNTVVPTVNKGAEGYRRLILGEGGVIEKWTKLGVKGWRLDVVDELPIEFTYELCKKIKECDADAEIIGEVWEDASTKESYGQWRPYFMGRQLDSVMNYPFKRAILKYALDNRKDDFICEVTKILENYPKQSTDALVNIIDSHDTVRALTALSGAAAPKSKAARSDFKLSEKQYAAAVRKLKLASVLQYTLPGMPCVFYGDEVGVQGFEDPMNRGTYPWGGEDEDILSHYRNLGNFRLKYKEVLKGETRFVCDKELLVFTRENDNGKLTIFANASEKTEERAVEGFDALNGKYVDRLCVLPYSAAVVFSAK
jgi:glycosidase